jgi:hypothetical protein
MLSTTKQCLVNMWNRWINMLLVIVRAPTSSTLNTIHNE